MAAIPRIAIVAMHLESNAFAPPSTEADFRSLCHLEGSAIVDEAAKTAPAMPLEIPGFVGELGRLQFPWTPVPVLVTGAEPGGPVVQSFFEDCIGRIVRELRRSAPIDAVYLSSHGAMTSTGDLDADGTLYSAIRSSIGPVPFVASVDLHANLSPRMIGSVDAFVSYRTNPHVDQRERGAECARHIVELLKGARSRTCLVRLPLTPASISLLTSEGPYADAMDRAETRMAQDPDLMNLSVVGGFVFSDTPKNGLSVVATSRRDAAHARREAISLAEGIWRDRHRFLRKLTSVAEAVSIARAAADGTGAPAIFADTGDNPGGGGRGNTTGLLRALLGSGADGLLFGNFVDGDLAADAHRVGVGRTFQAEFNRLGGDAFADRFTVPARVLALTDGRVVGRRGVYRGRSVDLGLTAALEVGGMVVVVSTSRKQCADPVFFEMHGLEIGAAKAVAVKSRGHFRAGFDEFFPPDRVFEIDTAGLTAPMLDQIAFRNLPRPVFPLDGNTAWTPDAG